MSPVIPDLFGATQSMQNAQVMTTTNGVARNAVKYITQRDQNNQVTVAPSVHNQVDTKFLHNTNITCSRINEDKAQYVTQRDQNKQVTVAPSVHNSAYMQVFTKFLHNTNITCSRINEDKAHQKPNR